MTQSITVASMFFILNVVIPSSVCGWHDDDKHERVIIDVPYKVKHVHHHHKVPVYIKEKPIIIKEHHHHHHKDTHHHKESSHHYKEHHDDHDHEKHDYHNHKYDQYQNEQQPQYNTELYHRKVDKRHSKPPMIESRERKTEMMRKILAQRLLLLSSLRASCNQQSEYNDKICRHLRKIPS